jgi:hypothetical protein
MQGRIFRNLPVVLIAYIKTNSTMVQFHRCNIYYNLRSMFQILSIYFVSSSTHQLHQSWILTPYSFVQHIFVQHAIFILSDLDSKW